MIINHRNNTKKGFAMIHNGTAVKDKDGNITGYIYGEVADLDMNKPVEDEKAPSEAPKKTTARKSASKK